MSITSASGASALTAEARSAAAGDIPDSQVFLAFRDAQARYSIKFPEGWAQKGAGGDVTFSDKNNLVHIVVLAGGPPTGAAVRVELSRLQASTPSLTFTPPGPIKVTRSEEHTAELQSQSNIVCRLLLVKKNRGRHA